MTNPSAAAPNHAQKKPSRLSWRWQHTLCTVLFVMLSWLLVLTVLVPQGAAEDPTCEPSVSSQVQTDVQSMLRAVDEGDVDTSLRFTHPKVLDLLGGAETAREVLLRLFASARESGLHRDAVSFPSPPTCVSAGRRRFAIVPTLSVFSTKTGRIESRSYQFGVKEPKQAGWTYLEGSRVNAQTIHRFFPEFPKGFSFPPVYRTPIDGR